MTARRPRPSRRPADRLVSPDASEVNVRADLAVAPFDEAARRMDVEWGIDRLPGLVSPETADKYARSLHRLNQFIKDENIDEIKKWAGVCIRGLAAMDNEARAAGCKPLPPDCWVVERDGRKFAFLRDMRTWPVVKKLLPDHFLYSLDEAVIGIDAINNKLVDEAKTQFPGSEITAFNKRPELPPAQMPDDEIPFGGDDE